MTPGTDSAVGPAGPGLWLAAWLALPLLVAALVVGAGLLVERASGRSLPGPLLPVVGLAAQVALGTLTTTFAASARWTALACSSLALAGVVLGWRRVRGMARPGARSGPAWTVGASLAVLLCYAAPVLMSGSATFASWITLDDGATWLAMADRLVTAGRNTTGLAPSTHEATLAVNWEGSSYPTGAFPLLGIAQQVLGIDGIHLIQPYLATLAALLACGLVGLLRTVPMAWPAAAAGSFVAAQPALLYAYALWGAVKELSLAPLVVAAALLATRPPGRGGPEGLLARTRAVLPFVVACAGVLAIAGLLGAAWLAVPAAALAACSLRLLGARATLSTAASSLALLALLVAPTQGATRLADLLAFADLGTTDDDIGNLWGPLSPAQVAGIWPAADFRGDPIHPWVTGALVGIAACLALAGTWHALRRRSWPLPTYAATVLPLALTLSAGGPWAAGKALAIASPAVLACAATGVWALAPRAGRGDTGRTAVTWLGAAAVALGVLWSNALAYRGAWLAPVDELAELRTIAADRELVGPTLMVDHSPYGARHLLRTLDAQGAGELRRWEIPTYSGSGIEPGAYADIDDFPTTSLAPFRTIVVRRSPLASRPPADFELAWSGRTYEAWSRAPGNPRTLSHVPFGDHANPVAHPQCAGLEQLAASAPEGSLLAVVERPAPVVAALDRALVPDGWAVSEDGSVSPGDAAGTVVYRVSIPADGRYVAWLPGSVRARVRLAIDATVLLDVRHRLTWPGHGTPSAAVTLAPGEHLVTVEYGGADWAPGSSGPQTSWGPPVLARIADEGTDPGPTLVDPATDPGPTLVDNPANQAPTLVDPADVGTVCGRTLDWVAIVAP